MMRLAVLFVLLSGCSAAKVYNPLDPKLPIEARRAFAAADDDEAIAEMDRDRAVEALAAARAHRKEVLTRLADWSKDASGAEQVREAYDAALDARVDQRQAGVRMAQAKLDLVSAQAARRRAETASRFDLAVVDLEPLKAAEEAATQRFLDARTDADAAEVAVEGAEDALWEVYRGYAASGGDVLPMWL